MRASPSSSSRDRRVAHRADLQRDEPVVLAVQRLDDPRLAARAQRLQQLVAVL